MDLLRALSMRTLSPPSEAGESSPIEALSPRDSLQQLSKDPYLREEERCQRPALLAMKSSVLLGCASDDWSVDSDYTFQDLADGADAHQAAHSRSASSSPERLHLVADTGTGKVKEKSKKAGIGTQPDARVEMAEAAAVAARDESDAVLSRKLSTANRRELNEVGANWQNEHQYPRPLESEIRRSGNPGSSTDSAQILRQEQRMFLKAAFQLLEERDHLFDSSMWSGLPQGHQARSCSDHHRRRGKGGDVASSGAGGVEGGGRRQPYRHGEGDKRLIKSGTLRKATSRSVGGRVATMIWKTKFVELTPGRFAYADGPSVLGTRSRSPKVIPLYLGFCTCRSVRHNDTSADDKRGARVLFSGGITPRGLPGLGEERGGVVLSGVHRRSGSSGGSSTTGKRQKNLLEIEVIGSKRRVWEAESRRERRRWVSAIRSAMTERPVDPKETVIGENQLPTIPPDSCHRADMERCDASASSPDKNAYSSDDAVTANTVEPENGEPTNGVSVVGEGKNLTVASLCRSIDGYLSARASLRTALSINDYLDALRRLRGTVGDSGAIKPGGGVDCSLCVPVKWVKQQLPGAERAYQVSDGRHRVKSELAQLWKDMKRDTVSINGRVLKGERGPEAIVGALTRCILAQAGRLPSSDSLSKLSEAQSLLTARDVLLACDRTTSGGDTYLVVDNLCRNPDLAVLVPASQEAEPLEIQVTLHPGASVQAPPPPRRGGAGDRLLASTGDPEPTTPPSASSTGARSPLAPVVTTPEDGGGGIAVTKGRTASSFGATSVEGDEEPPIGLGACCEEVSRSPKQRGRLSLPPRRPRPLHATGCRVPIAPAPPASPMSSSTTVYHNVPGNENNHGKAKARAASDQPVSPIVERDRFLCATSRGAKSGGGGGGILQTLVRWRGVRAPTGGHSREISSPPATPNMADDAPATLEGSKRDRGCIGNAQWQGTSSAPAGVATSRSFFGEDTTDEGGQGSDSSSDESVEHGRLRRRSYIRVACKARTSYKVFSSDPQDEERDVYAVITGLFEQAFTISRELPAGIVSIGRRTASGMGSATYTEGSVAFLTFREPLIRRESIGGPQSAASTPRAACPHFDAAENHEVVRNGDHGTAVDHGKHLCGTPGEFGERIALPLGAYSPSKPRHAERQANSSAASLQNAATSITPRPSDAVKMSTQTPFGVGEEQQQPRSDDRSSVRGPGKRLEDGCVEDLSPGEVDTNPHPRLDTPAAFTPVSIAPAPSSPESTAARSRNDGVKTSAWGLSPTREEILLGSGHPARLPPTVRPCVQRDGGSALGDAEVLQFEPLVEFFSPAGGHHVCSGEGSCRL